MPKMGYYQFSIILICYIFLISFNTLDADATVSYDGPAIVHESQPFSIFCYTNSFANFKWRQNNSNIDSENNVSYSQDKNPNGLGQYSNISVAFALPKHQGNYKCSYENDDYGHNLTVVVGSTIKLTVESARGSKCRPESQARDLSKCVLGSLYEPVTLECRPDVPLNDSLTIAWYKSDRSSKDGEKDKVVIVKSSNRIKVSGGKLEIEKIYPEDFGIFHCRLVNKGQENENLAPITHNFIELQVLPSVVASYKDITVVEENRINLTCTVIGSATRVVWKFGDKVLFNGTDDRVKLEEFHTVKDAMLLIDRANYTTDRGSYNCTAESLVGNSSNSATCYVRVKGKLAALGPFLGICTEVIILCTIILIYEKKRDKTELEESDTDQGPETKSSPDHGQDSVRYRK